MTKIQLDYVKARVRSVVSCTNGNIVSKMNTLLKECKHSRTEKLNFIAKGEAQLLDSEGLRQVNDDMGYNPNVRDVLVACFSYPHNKNFVRYRKFNERVKAACDEMQSTVEASGREIVDKVVISELSGNYILKSLTSLARMDVMATNYVAAIQEEQDG